MNVPILLAHDHRKPIGCVEVVDGQLHVRFAADITITKDMAFEIFGDAGLQVLECTEENGVMLIRHGRILEWSLSPPPVGPATGMDATVLKMQRDSLRDALARVLDARNREAKAAMSYRTARENFSSSDCERQAHARAMLAASDAEREAATLLLMLRDVA